ncbi:N-acetyltransferase GCN5 [Halorubrum californiense DSM 19288]|uniref:N-acetyltransferase GCN5 n=1 Tax=Halorubrum californiense DSM 19288 TaxID=1227465 RepID=M0E5S4_9EURY|nr:GNAT family protein [Halorubrum californiense]ELZ43135.1 N-acetyltransferase GCN5 [Halorubrum californiense DSM 19288]
MSVLPVEMKSDRLHYKRLHPDEFDPYELYTHAKEGSPGIDEITEYVTWNPYTNPQAAFDWVDKCGAAFENGESATYVIRPKEGERADELAGIAGIHPDWDRQFAELGTWLRKPFWGQGYSGERAARFLEVAFDWLDLQIVTITHHPENTNSKRAIEKYVERFGGHKEGRLRNNAVMDGEPHDTVRYTIARQEWEQNRRGEQE